MNKFFKNPNYPKRHSLIPHAKYITKKDDGLESAKESKPYTINDLKKDLQTAMQLELSTIPPYLCALYSIQEGSNKMASEIIKSVVLEEMLHMVMVANLINAIGSKPVIGKVKGEPFIPTYPTQLPGNVDPSLTINLSYMSFDQIQVFCKIEHPGDEEKEASNLEAFGPEYRTIGEFYDAISKNIKLLEEAAQVKGKTIFTGDSAKQVTPEHYYGAGGGIIPVTNLASAEAVIAEIVGQGEGVLDSIFSIDFDKHPGAFMIFGADVEEYAHYFRFKEVLHGRFYRPTDSAHRDSPNHGLPTGEPIDVDWNAVYKMEDNPKMANYPKGSEIYNKMYDFNKTYMALLDNLNKACNGHPEDLRKGIMVMYDLKYKAIELMKIPSKNGRTVGPSFEYLED